MLPILLFWLLPIAVALLVGWAALRVRPDRFSALRVVPDARWMPIAVGVISAVVTWYVWGSMNQVAIVHDEASYLLQARTFALGRWAMPSPPLPQFFEQFHVFVTPTYASKYPPGHGLLLVPGVWIGFPGLVPLILSGVTGALLFGIVRRVTNGSVALLTLLFWLMVKTNLNFRASYFSETTTSALWLLGWYGLLEWRAHGRERWLLLVAGSVGWMAITRPLTAVAYAIPIGIVVLWTVARRRQWRVLVRPVLLGTAIVALLPIWSTKTIGTWRTTPYALYSKIYFPFDAMGFGYDRTPPERPLPTDMQTFIKAMGPMHAEYTVDRLPETLLDRWRALFTETFTGWRIPLLVFAVLGLALLPSAGWFAVGSSVLLTLCYLSFAHPAAWTVYYLEITPLFPFLIACGVWIAWRAMAARDRLRSSMLRDHAPQGALAAVALGILLLLPAGVEIARGHRFMALRQAYHRGFASAVSQIPDARSIVFIRYAPWHNVHSSLIANDADLADARTWFVYDRGAEDARLLARAPGRVPYLFDEAAARLTRVTPSQLAAGAAPASAAPAGGTLAQAKPRS